MSTPPIYFHSEQIAFQLDNEKATANWIEEIIQLEHKNPGTLNIVFCSDDYLHSINQEYLNHDTLTDIVTFNYVEGETISGDLFISVDRVRENSKNLSLPFFNEIHRVIIHGVLHLIGYDDKKADDALEIRDREDFCLTLHPEI